MAAASSDLSGDSFIVKVWVEHPATRWRGARWRGHVTNVLSGQRRYVQCLDEIPVVLMPYLEEMGVRFGTVWQVRKWLSGRQHPR